MNTGCSRRLVVTGAAGFLGRYIVADLANKGWSVIGLDRVSPSKDDALSGQVLEWCEAALPSDRLAHSLAYWQPCALVHAAGPASVPASLHDPWSDFDGNVSVFFHVLDSVRRHAPECRVILLSSAAVYGNPLVLPVGENAPVRPISPYGFHKRLCEQLAEEFHVLYGLRVCSARIFSAYGPGLRRQVLWDICQKALHQPFIQLLGTGQETRDFIHAQDIAGAIALLLRDADFDEPVYNLATGEETTIAELATILCSALGVSKEINFTGTLRQGDPSRWCADTSRLRALDFQPGISIGEGALRYARWILEKK